MCVTDIQGRVVAGYISECEAIERLERLTGMKITIEDMEECALRGVIPAYIQFMPKNKTLYSGTSFYLGYDDAIEHDNLANLTTFDGGGCEEDFWKVIPFPLPSDGLVKTNNGLTYRVFVSRNDAQLEPVTDQHYVRVYSDQELRQTAKNVKRYLSKGEVNPKNHACCQTWEKDPDNKDLTAAWIISPFAENENIQDSKLKDNRERTSLHLIIAALASQAGYSLDKPKEAEARLIKVLALMGICNDGGGKGTVEKHFEAARVTVGDAKKRSNICVPDK